MQTLDDAIRDVIRRLVAGEEAADMVLLVRLAEATTFAAAIAKAMPLYWHREE